jgi:hypothetical protein
MPSYDECGICLGKYSPQSNGPRTPIVGTCGHDFCRECVQKMHMSEVSIRNIVNVKCATCRTRSFRADKLVINRGLCEALAVIRGVATPGQVEQEQPAITSHESTEGRRTENNVVLNSEARDTARKRVEQEQPATSHESAEDRRTQNNVVSISDASDTARKRPRRNRPIVNYAQQPIVPDTEAGMYAAVATGSLLMPNGQIYWR